MSPQDETNRIRQQSKLHAKALKMWAWVLVALVVTGGLFLAGMHHWRRGSFAIGAALCLAALLRAFLSDNQAGLLKVRSVWVDVVTLLALGIPICILALAVPGTP